MKDFKKNEIKNVIIKIENLKKKYGKKNIFEKLNLEIKKGDRIALVGPNGVGKTTLVEMICGLRKVTEGKIKFIESKNQLFNRLGMQFQIGNYPEGIRVKDMIYLYSKVYKQNIDPEFKKQFKIGEIENKELNSLSFGQQKRIELFLLLASKLSFLILDEITSGMDISIKLVILKILKNYLKENKADLIYISHNMNEINILCNRLIVMTKQGITLDTKIDAKFNVQKTVSKILIGTDTQYENDETIKETK